MICPGCGKEVGDIFCGNCREEIQGIARAFPISGLVPILYWDEIAKGYRAGCLSKECPFNNNGACSTLYLTIEEFTKRVHEFDGDNCVWQACG